MYSNCKENIITEDLGDTVSASPSCSRKFLRRADAWVPICVGAVGLLEHSQDMPFSYVEAGTDCLRIVCFHVFLALPRGLSVN